MKYSIEEKKEFDKKIEEMKINVALSGSDLEYKRYCFRRIHDIERIYESRSNLIKSLSN